MRHPTPKTKSIKIQSNHSFVCVCVCVSGVSSIAKWPRGVWPAESTAHLSACLCQPQKFTDPRPNSTNWFSNFFFLREITFNLFQFKIHSSAEFQWNLNKFRHFCFWKKKIKFTARPAPGDRYEFGGSLEVFWVVGRYRGPKSRRPDWLMACSFLVLHLAPPTQRRLHEFDWFSI